MPRGVYTRKPYTAEHKANIANSVRRPIEKRFWKRVKKTGGCWLWAGAKAHGYGHLTVDNISKSAHRVAWELTHGPVPEGLSVLHHCDNPACVRPDHLFLGTQNDNIQDAKAKGRLKRK